MVVMMYAPRRPFAKPPRYVQFLNSLPGSSYIDSFLSKLRRLHRHHRVKVPMTIRLTLVLLTIAQFYIDPFRVATSMSTLGAFLASKPSAKISSVAADLAVFKNVHHLGIHEASIKTTNQHDAATGPIKRRHATSPNKDDTEMLPVLLTICSRLVMVAGVVLCLLSVIFFDTMALSMASVGVLFLHLFNTSACSCESVFSCQWWVRCICNACFMATPVIFSSMVGRRRSITKPTAVRCLKKSYLAALPYNVRNIDAVDVAVRLQASLLMLDYTYASPRVSFLLSLPIALAFFIGFQLRRTGILVIGLLLYSALLTPASPILAFPATTSAATAMGALLVCIVGPCYLTADEWLTTKAFQLYY